MAADVFVKNIWGGTASGQNGPNGWVRFFALQFGVKKKKPCNVTIAAGGLLYIITLFHPDERWNPFFLFFFFFEKLLVYIFSSPVTWIFFPGDPVPSIRKKTAASWKRVKFLFYRFCCCRSFHFLPPFCVFFFLDFALWMVSRADHWLWFKRMAVPPSNGQFSTREWCKKMERENKKERIKKMWL